jgi:hypothetical protein
LPKNTTGDKIANHPNAGDLLVDSMDERRGPPKSLNGCGTVQHIDGLDKEYVQLLALALQKL